MKNLLFILICIFSFFSCRKENAMWDVGLLSPLIKTKFTIKDLVSDSLIKADSSKLVHLVFDRSLYSLSVDSFFSINDTTVAKSFAIDSLRLYTLNITYPLTLASIARQSGAIGALILALHGNVFAIPSIGPLSVPPVVLNADTLFTSMTLDDGKIGVSFENNLPIDITDLKFQLKNAATNQKLLDGNFPVIKSKTKETQTYSLAGLTVDSKILVEVSNFSSPGSNGVPVLIDTSNSIVANLSVYDLRPSKATAIWPAQNIIDQHLDFNLRRLEVQLKYAKIKTGKIFLKLRSTIDDTLRFYYSLPGATKNGLGFEIRKMLPPGSSINPSDIYEVYDFSGYDLDLSGTNKDTFNATPNSIIVSIDSTGIQKTFSKADNIQVELGFQDLKPSYARGYLGTDTFNFGPSTIDLDFFKNLNGMINFEDIQLNVGIENNIGAEGEFLIQNISSINTRTNSKIQLNAAELTNPIFIPKASDNAGFPPVNASISNVKLNKENSNINSCINLIPDKFEYSLQLNTNPFGNKYNFQDFIYDGKLMNIDINLDVPLYLSMKDLILKKNIELNTANLDLQNALDGKLYIIVYNGFPIESNIIMEFLDATGQSSSNFVKVEGVVSAAQINSVGNVDHPEKTIIEVPISIEQMKNFNQAKSINIQSSFLSKPVDQSLKIFDSYQMDISISADLNYKVN